MLKPKVSDIVGIINRIAPFALAEDWDNVGLQVGDPAGDATRIMIALDPGRGAVEAAIDSGCTLLLTHHPLIFSPLKKISCNDPTGALIFQAIKNNLALVSLHTNYDIASGGMNDLLASRLGLADSVPLRIESVEELVKIAVFVPAGHEEQLLEALFRFTAPIGAYRDCSFRTGGSGTFTPLTGATPFIGTPGVRQVVDEVRVEVLVRKGELSGAVKALLAAHPYEEPAFDIYPLLNKGETRGLGRIGYLPEPVTAGEFALQLKETLGLAMLRLVGDRERAVRKIAVCGGSGASLLKDACRQGADVLVTGDIKYHEAREAESAGMVLMDAGHFATEVIMVQEFSRQLGQLLAEKKYEAEVIAYSGETEPFTYL
jgi:dinuclear metal center YbgI/SA1388 family protein